MKIIEEAAALRAVWFIPDEFSVPGEWGFDQVAFVFDRHVLVFTPLADTDEVAVAEVEAREFRVMPQMEQSGALFGDLAGRSISDLWRCTNSRGYGDMVVLSFGLLIPDLALLAMGSALRLYRLQPALRTSGAPGSGFCVD